MCAPTPQGWAALVLGYSMVNKSCVVSEYYSCWQHLWELQKSKKGIRLLTICKTKDRKFAYTAWKRTDCSLRGWCFCCVQTGSIGCKHPYGDLEKLIKKTLLSRSIKERGQTFWFFIAHFHSINLNLEWTRRVKWVVLPLLVFFSSWWVLWPPSLLWDLSEYV